MINFDEYQANALKTVLTTAYNEEYLVSGLAGEVGEVASLYAKSVRDGHKEDYYDEMMAELSDILWFVAVLGHLEGYNLSEIAEYNNKKLLSRMERGVLSGSGDHR